jgi:hypothetical protein
MKIWTIPMSVDLVSILSAANHFEADQSLDILS